MNADHTVTDARVAEATADLARNGTLEWSFPRDGELKRAAESLPRGTALYVPCPPAGAPELRLQRVRAVHEAGFDPVPHITARGLRSEQELREFLEPAVAHFGVHRVLLVAGVQPAAAGPWGHSLALLESGLLAASGVREVAIAGHPEGLPHATDGAPFEWLRRKQAAAHAQGLGIEVITQFSFLPARVTEYCAELARHVPGLPVYAGIAGPSDVSDLRRFARRCAVSASLRALDRLGYRSAAEAVHLDPAEQLAALAHYCALRPDPNVVGVHLYCCGGLPAASRWLRRRFADPSGSHF